MNRALAQTQPVASEAPPPDPAPAPAKRRIWAVDLVRLIASFQMINGHTLHATMVESVRSGPIYDDYIWLRGLVSVSFLLVAGLAFHLATLARFEKHKADGKAVWKRYRRVLILLFWGYALHAPLGIFDSDPAVAEASLRHGLSIGVLQSIALVLLALQAMTTLFPKPRYVVIGAVVGMIACFAAAPWLDAHAHDYLGLALGNYVSHAQGSSFPLLPWGGFMFAGTVLGAYVLPQGVRTPNEVLVRRLVVALGIGFLTWQALSLSLDVGLFSLPEGAAYATHPAFVFEKLTAVIGLLLVLAVLSRSIRRLPKLLSILSGESLSIYVFHLVLLYVVGIGPMIGRTLSLPMALLASACMMVVTVSFAVGLHHAKRKGWVWS